MRIRSGITILELLVALIVIGLIATLVVIKWGEAREKAYVAAMMNDLRHYALIQVQYHSNHGTWGSEDVLTDTNLFMYSHDVSRDSAYTTDDAFYLRVRHRKTDRICELEVVNSGFSATQDRIRCPGYDRDIPEENPTPGPTLAAPTVIAPGDLLVSPGGTYTLDFEVVNNSGTTRTFNFVASSSDPAVAPNPADPPSVSIGAHDQVVVTVSVNVSPGAIDDESSRIFLSVIDADAPAYSGSGESTLVVKLVPVILAPTVMAPANMVVSHNVNVDATFTVRNNSNVVRDYQFQAIRSNSHLTIVSVIPPNATIPPGEVVTVVVRTRTFNGTPGGTTTEVSLQVTDTEDESYWHSGSHQRTAAHRPPFATITCPTTVFVGQTYTCTASYDDPDGDLVASSWGGLATSMQYTARSTPGTEQRSVIAFDAADLSYTAIAQVQVVSLLNQPPTVTLSCESPVFRGAEYTCTAAFDDPDGDLSHTSWGDLSVTSMTFMSSFVPTVEERTITVYDASSLSATDRADVEVVNRPPEAEISCPSTVSVNQSFACEVMASDPDGDEVFSSWGGWTQTFQFSTLGTQIISVTVEDAYGDSVTESGFVVVQGSQDQQTPSNNPPVANFVQESCQWWRAGDDETFTVMFTFRSTSYDPDDDELTYIWSADNGLPFSGSGSTFIASPHFVINPSLPAGSHPPLVVRLLVHDGRGGYDEAIAEVPVEQLCGGVS